MPEPAHRAPRIDLFCRVVDHLGDAAVLWRLARQLAREHGADVRLWIDRPAVLARLVPDAMPGRRVHAVDIAHWSASDPRLAATGPDDVADVVIAGFAVEPPPAYRIAMRVRRPLWIDVDHLSAEGWVDGSHGLPSPKPDGLVEHFWFPGPSDAAGGLLREGDLCARRDAFRADPRERAAVLASLGVAPDDGDAFASMFCYPDSPVPAVAQALAADPGRRWRLLLPHEVAPELAPHPIVRHVPFVPQHDYDRLLWACDLNWVRGEDSVVRALWAGRPWVWQAYRQADEPRADKIDAWLDRWRDDARPQAAAERALRDLHAAWNRAPDPSAAAATGRALPAVLAALPELAAAAARACDAAAARPSLADRLWAFIRGRL